MRIRVLALAILAISATSTGSAQAGGWAGWPYTSSYVREYIPYYALHPPVYYSYPVPRTYGYSPFAYPPGYPTPDVQISEVQPGEVIENPYVPAGRFTPSDDRVTRVRPKTVVNPYFESLSGESLVGADSELQISPATPVAIRPVESR